VPVSELGAWNTRLEKLLRETSRSFHLSLRFLPAPLREPLSIAYLLARSSDTLADSPHAEVQIRVQALDALEQALHRIGSEASPLIHITLAARAHAVQAVSGIPGDSPAEGRLLAHLDAVLESFERQNDGVRREVLEVLGPIISAQRQDLLRFGDARADAPRALESAAECEDYTYAVAGCVGEFWTRICALRMPHTLAAPKELLMLHGKRLGQGLQLVNILRDLPADLARGCCYLPRDEIEALGLELLNLTSNPAAARSWITPWMARAREWLAHGERYVEGIRGWRLRFSVILPRLLGEATLDLLQKNPPLETRERVRVDRKTVFRCLWEASLEASHLF
jgi:farnesyl-diphosphate farnesyltransferase